MNKEKAYMILKDVYKKYKEKGLRAIYAWGSITTKEFMDEKSDIDTIGIIENEIDIEGVNQELQKHYSKFKMNVLYKEELDGKRIKSRLASLIHPKILLLEFKNWEFVCGKKYMLSDFEMIVPSYDEAISLEHKKLDEYADAFKQGNFASIEYYVKTFLMLCHYRNCKEKEYKFTYEGVLQNAVDKEIVETLLRIRENNYNSLEKEIIELEQKRQKINDRSGNRVF